MVSRRLMQSALGAIWFLDGLFQLKPQMFSKAFVKQVILPTAQGQPHWISGLVNWGAHLVVGHIAMWNTLFALVQLALGIAFIFNYRIKQAIIASVVWSGIVWIFGEGVGQILTGQSLLLSGAPGAVLLYALIGVSIWPKNGDSLSEWRVEGVRFAQISLAILMAAGFIMHLQPSFLIPNGLSQSIAVPWLANVIGNSGAIASVILGIIELALGVLLFFRYKIRLAASVSIALSIVFWWVGQSFGQIFDPLATDFNSGLLMALLAVCANPELWKLPIRHQRIQHNMS